MSGAVSPSGLRKLGDSAPGAPEMEALRKEVDRARDCSAREGSVGVCKGAGDSAFSSSSAAVVSVAVGSSAAASADVGDVTSSDGFSSVSFADSLGLEGVSAGASSDVGGLSSFLSSFLDAPPAFLAFCFFNASSLFLAAATFSALALSSSAMMS
ncbi:hypothetical protein B0H65DRAFT_457672 [Neurospora tetraspora]|uniref:Uncharacterized protein n=1 Tax=Neurospora tetraspora TaxID=94610 RepID=A0AAE0JLD7_9PEZI|nr:hypothetical protein B0H65DRAFT_457672 [Neurospora tetraspora]